MVREIIPPETPVYISRQINDSSSLKVFSDYSYRLSRIMFSHPRKFWRENRKLRNIRQRHTGIFNDFYVFYPAPKRQNICIFKSFQNPMPVSCQIYFIPNLRAIKRLSSTWVQSHVRMMIVNFPSSS